MNEHILKNLERLVRIAQASFRVPIVKITRIDENEQEIQAGIGVTIESIPRSAALCELVMRDQSQVTLENTRDHPELQDHPVVQGGIAFYVGYPIRDTNSILYGTFCLADFQEQLWTTSHQALLEDFVAIAEALMFQ